VTFLENLDFRDQRAQRSWAIKVIPPSLLPIARDLGTGVRG
jgi:hypothetical protein